MIHHRTTGIYLRDTDVYREEEGSDVSRWSCRITGTGGIHLGLRSGTRCDDGGVGINNGIGTSVRVRGTGHMRVGASTSLGTFLPSLRVHRDVEVVSCPVSGQRRRGRESGPKERGNEDGQGRRRTKRRSVRTSK